MDTIAGHEAVSRLRERALEKANEARAKHEELSAKYDRFRKTEGQIERLEELNRGVQQLTEANLVSLRDRYRNAVETREAIHAALGAAKDVPSSVLGACTQAKAGIGIPPASTGTDLDALVGEIQGLSGEIVDALSAAAKAVEDTTARVTARWGEILTKVDEAFTAFAEQYDEQVSKLSPEQRKLLERHREVSEQTKSLPELRRNRDILKATIVSQLEALERLCSEVASTLEERTRLRQEAVARLSDRVEHLDIKLEVLPHSIAQDFERLAQQYTGGRDRFAQLGSKAEGNLAHTRFSSAYRNLRLGLSSDWGDLLFGHSDLSFYLTSFEDDDLKIQLRVGGTLRPIDQLSAGQRCTAIFPVLLEMDSAPLIVDQPEDNLDNRYIASLIAPAVMARKRVQQMCFTSHNANLVVLSDPEMIAAIESDGNVGRIEKRGFLACPGSPITQYVLDMVDGGEKALEQRYQKYGKGRK